MPRRIDDQTSLNLYGKDIQAALQAAPDHKVTPALVHSLDDKDSDGDGWPNAAEFKADTLPGDPASKPPGTPPAAPKANPAPAAGGGSNPFGLQALLYPSHAQHPILIHFPIALFVLSYFFDLLGHRTGNRSLNAAGHYNLVAAAITAVFSVITGLLAWKFAFGLESLSGDWHLLYHLFRHCHNGPALRPLGNSSRGCVRRMKAR